MMLNPRISRNLFACSKRYLSTLEPNKNYDVVIIGGGHNGLVAAAYLAKGGKSVCVLERRHILGGAAVTEEIIPGFQFSRASYVLGLLRPQIYKELELERHGLKVKIRNPSSYTPLHDSYWSLSKAKSLTLGPNEKENFQQLSQFSSKDANAFPIYEKTLNKYIDAISPLLDTRPPNLENFYKGGLLSKLASLRQFSALYSVAKRLGSDLPRFMELMTAPTNKILDRWFESEPLKATLATDSVIGAMISPATPGSGYVLLHHVMAQVGELKGAWGNPVGGMGSVSKAIASSATEAGAQLFVNQTVDEILTDSNGSVRGVKTVDGREISSSVVFSNATPHVTYLQLLPNGSLPEQFEKAVKSIDYSSAVCKLNVALNKLPNFVANPNHEDGSPLPHHGCTIHLNCENTEMIEEAYLQAKNGCIPDRPMIEMTLPSSSDSSISPKRCHVALFFTQYAPYQHPSGSWNDVAKKDYADRIFNTVESYAPGFRESIVGYEVLPPPDLEEIFGLTGGNIFHGSMALDQLYINRPTPFGPFSPIEGLILCGSGAHPGGGVMGSPGKLAAQIVLGSRK